MTKIFISYRREDSQWPAHTLYNKIKSRSPDPENDVFIDIDNIPLGVNFKDHIAGRIGECDILLALIGPDWLEARNSEGKRRLDNPDDFVRVEIASALERGTRVIPVLLDGAQVPSAEVLPDNLKELSMRNGVDVSRASFEGDSDRLLAGIGLAAGPDGVTLKRDPKWVSWIFVSVLLAIAAVIGTAVMGLVDLNTLFETEDIPVEPSDDTPASIDADLPGQPIRRTPRLGITVLQDGQPVPMRHISSTDINPNEVQVYVEREPFEIVFNGSHWTSAKDENPALRWAMSNERALYDYTLAGENTSEQSIFHWACGFAIYQFGSSTFYLADMGADFEGFPCGNNYVGLEQFTHVEETARQVFVSDVKAEADGDNLLKSLDKLYTVVFLENDDPNKGQVSDTIDYYEFENITFVLQD